MTRVHGRHHVYYDDEIVVLLPDLRLLRVIARSVLLAAALLSFPCFHTTLFPGADGSGPVTGNGSDPKWVDNPFMLRMLLADLKREGLLNPELFSVFLGDPGSSGPFLKKNGMYVMWPAYKKMLTGDNSVDFVLAADGMTDSSFRFVDRVLKVGGIVAVLLGSNPNRPFCLPSNYRVRYVRQFGSTFVAIKKMYLANADEFNGGLRSRRLLSIAKKMKQHQPKKTMYLLKLKVNDDSFGGYLFEIDPLKENGEFEVLVVVSVGGVKERMANWFNKYMKGKETMMEMKKIIKYLFDIDPLKENGEFEVLVAVSVGGVKERMANWFNKYMKGKETMMEMKKIIKY